MLKPREIRRQTLGFMMCLIAAASLPPVIVLSADTTATVASTAKDAGKKAEGEKSDAFSPKEWLAFAGTVSAALIAGFFALYQLRRSTAAQRALEREKLVTARTEAELAQVRTSNRDYRRGQALPFLEELDRTLNESYKAAYMPPYFPDLGGYVPQLRRYADRPLVDWLEAMEAMSRHRMRLLLVISRDRVETVTSLLTQLVELMKQIMEVRNQVWFRKASAHDLWEAQRAYVRVGYRLMMEVWDALPDLRNEQTQISESAKEKLAEALTIPFEKGSAVSVPFGSSKDYCWIAIWEINTNPEWKRFVESLTHATHEEFEERLTGLAGSLYKDKTHLTVHLSKVRTEDLEVPCLVVVLASAKRLEAFLDMDLETHRQANPVLWSTYRTPIEIVIGLEEKEMKKKRSRPDESRVSGLPA